MFSIVIPYYKKQDFILRCLYSVFNQSYTDFEVILVDDGSQDNLPNFLKSNFDFFNDSRLKIFSKENSGVSGARNFGIENASGNYIAFLDADDCWHKDYLLFALEIIEKEKDVTIIGFHYTRNYEMIKQEKQLLSYYVLKDYFKVAIRNILFTSSSSIIKRSIAEKIVFSTSITRGEDIDFWIKTVFYGKKAVYVSTTMVYYSDEDTNQLTKLKVDVSKTFVGNINTVYENLRKNTDDSYFDKFISLYVYFNLYPYYFDEANHQQAKKVLKQNQHFFFFLHLPYLMPLSIGEKIVSNTKSNYYLRSYFKFINRLMTR